MNEIYFYEILRAKMKKVVTLIEMLVVIAIIGMLAGVVLVSLLSTIKNLRLQNFRLVLVVLLR